MPSAMQTRTIQKRHTSPMSCLHANSTKHRE